MSYYNILSKTTGETLGTVYASDYRAAKCVFCRQSGLGLFWTKSVDACAV